MIDKSRLEELIEQGAIVYEVVYSYNGDKVCEYDLKNIPTYDKTHLDHFQDMHNLFETLEEAEWHKEFGCIERTERLELPTWEEFRNGNEFDFMSKKEIRIYVLNHFFDNEIYISDLWGYSETFEYSKDGYTLACRKAKELFLGEKE